MTLPPGWTKTILNHIAFVQTGLSKSENRQGPSVRKPYLRVANVQDGYLDLREIKEIDVPKGQLHRFLLRPGDLLLTEGGDFDKLGRGCIWNGDIPECVHQNHIFAVRLIEKSGITSQFLAYQMQSKHGRAYFLACAKQTTNLASINSGQLKDFPVLIPPPFEQKRMCSIFSLWDTAIKKTELLITAKNNYKIGLMQELLTRKLRLKGFKTAWTTFHLGDLFNERAERGTDHLPLLAITREEGVISRDELDRRDTSSEDKSSYLRICPGDIGYNTMRMWQGVSALSQLEGIVSPAYTICIPNEHVHGKFMAYLFKLPQVVHLFYRYSQGLTSDTWNLKFHHFAEIKVHIPSFEEQAAIAAVLETADAELKILRRQKLALEQQKRSLMQKLLTGQWRVKVTDTEAA